MKGTEVEGTRIGDLRNSSGTLECDDKEKAVILNDLPIAISTHTIEQKRRP